jgi:hypothetical protein
MISGAEFNKITLTNDVPLKSNKDKSPWYPLDRMLFGPQSWSGCNGKEKKFPSLPLLAIGPQFVYVKSHAIHHNPHAILMNVPIVLTLRVLRCHNRNCMRS